jgi:hypothetical protein
VKRKLRTGRKKPRYCEIVVRGEFGELLTTTFNDVEVEVGDGQTVLKLTVADESHFYGVLDRLRDLAIEVISLRELPTPQS